MSDFATFFQIGIRHIIDVSAMDHILFLLALAAIYRFSDWRDIIRVVTAFTIGHSITLAAAVFGYLPLSQSVVEFLIPVTIVATCIENILVKDRGEASVWRRYRPVFATVFGLVHGAGFGGYLKSLFVDSVAIPLFGFNMGIELGQITVLAFVFAAIWVLDSAFRAIMRSGQPERALRIRVIGVSAVVMVFATRWAFERTPW